MIALDCAGKAWIDAYNGITWLGWIPIATATPPQEYSLPLADGWTAHRRSVYFKTQDNVVTVFFQLHTDSPQIGEVNIAYLPEGYRPAGTIGGTGYCAASGEDYLPADTKVYPNGNITGYNTVCAAEYYTGLFTFVADS